MNILKLDFAKLLVDIKKGTRNKPKKIPNRKFIENWLDELPKDDKKDRKIDSFWKRKAEKKTSFKKIKKRNR